MSYDSPLREYVVLSLFAVIALAGCDRTEPKTPGAEDQSTARALADARQLKRACGSAATYDRLKALTFDEAGRIQRGTPGLLDRIEANATIRMEDPVATSRNDKLDITVCEGQLVLDLPPGIEDVFDGERRLRAKVQYSAQAAADGSGLVYQMRGAEPIIYRLAALTLPDTAARSSVAEPDLSARPTTQVAATSLPATTPMRAAGEAPRAVPVPPARLPTAVPTVPQTPKSAPAGASPPVRRAPATARPSFDCGSVTSRVLRLVCADPALAASDRRMSSAYYESLASGDGATRAALRTSRDRFLRSRNRCTNEACVAQSYDDRIDEIRAIARRD